ncbi:MAG: phosphoribosylformylglycinamidine synthase subunit PurQ, partial [Saprospiraceae bacterium]
CHDIRKIVEPTLHRAGGSIFYINMSFSDLQLGGSSFAQAINGIGDIAPDVTDALKFKQAFDTVQQLISSEMIAAGHDIGSGGLVTTLLEMCFADTNLGADIDLSSLDVNDSIRLLFAENVGIVFQVVQGAENIIKALFDDLGMEVHLIGKATSTPVLNIKNKEDKYLLDIPKYRDIWYKTSYLMDIRQSGAIKARERFDNYKNQSLQFEFPNGFDGKLPVLPTNGKRIKAAVIREKGSNSERELANALYMAGFDVKDVHMTDLISGRETLEDIRYIGAVGGFSNSDVLGSAKGWAGAFKYNEKAKTSLDNFFKRTDTLSVGICNGCQLFVELGLLYPEHPHAPKMDHNESHKHESSFTSVSIAANHSIMMHSLEGSTLGVWISHGEGKFVLKGKESDYHIVAKYGHETYPANPNGSDYNTAMMCSADGRHLVMMPHIERSTFQWNWAHYPSERKDEVSPWLEAFINARIWLENNQL